MAKVKFLKPYQMWNDGEVAGFEPEMAARLVAAKVACLVEVAPVVKPASPLETKPLELKAVSVPEELEPPPKRNKRRRRATTEE